MQLTINGEDREFEDGTVLGLLESLNVHQKTVVVELNGHILQRNEYQTRSLQSGDVLEIVQMMAGG
jgi:sulfur carrier protein